MMVLVNCCSRGMHNTKSSSWLCGLNSTACLHSLLLSVDMLDWWSLQAVGIVRLKLMLPAAVLDAN